MRKAAFIDRDGVINQEVNYLHEADKTALIPGVGSAIRKLNEAGVAAVVVTNQAGVAKGYYPESDIALVHERIRELLAEEGAFLDGIYYCPHHEDFTGKCECRKPAPGMLLRAAEELELDCSISCMIGDRLSDVGAGHNAGCSRCFLVRTGYGEKVIAANPVLPDYCETAEDLADAVNRFLGM